MLLARFLRFLDARQRTVCDASNTRLLRDFEKTNLLIGRLLSNVTKPAETVEDLHDVEFKVFSQWGDDGIIQYLVHRVNISKKSFIEFGVEDYREANTRFLLLNNNW